MESDRLESPVSAGGAGGARPAGRAGCVSPPLVLRGAGGCVPACVCVCVSVVCLCACPRGVRPQVGPCAAGSAAGTAGRARRELRRARCAQAKRGGSAAQGAGRSGRCAAGDGPAGRGITGEPHRSTGGSLCH